MCGGGGGRKSSPPPEPAPAPAAPVIGAIQRQRSAGGVDKKYGVRAQQANGKRRGKSRFRVTGSVGTANVGGSASGSGLNIPKSG